jgi:hypothetical protein
MTIEALPPVERTLPAMLAAAPRRHGERPLLTFGATSWSHPRPAAPRRRARGDAARGRRSAAATASP